MTKALRTSSKFSQTGFGKTIAALTANRPVDGGLVSFSGEKLLAAFVKEAPQTMNDVLAVYDAMLTEYKSTGSAKGDWPIICIDEVNVLTEWQQGSLEEQKALGALLRFFVKVCRVAGIMDVLYKRVCMSQMFFEQSAGHKTAESGACNSGHF